MRKRGMGDRGKSTHFLETRRQGDVGEKKRHVWVTKGRHSLPENQGNWLQSAYLSFVV
jgi:hypothetical protein